MKRALGDLVFSLEELTHSGPEWWGSAARVTIRDKDQPSRDWKPLTVRVSDATGNARRTPVPDPFGPEHIPFQGLCRKETAWKVRAAFVAREKSAVPPDYVWTVRDLPAPAPDGYVELGFRGEYLSVPLTLERLAGIKSGTNPEPFALVSIRSDAEAARVTLLGGVDERGRDLLPPQGFGLAPGLEGARSQDYWLQPQTHHFGLVIPPGARKMHLSFGIHRARVVEFLAKP